jgi:NAD(P)-dependent dehydrogenase (short-subunit alcohol dehydrogenase family)
MKYLVTGANRGLGLEFTRQLIAREDQVIATCRRPDEAEELNKLARSSVHIEAVLELDVGDAASVAKFAEALDSEAVDVLINNAGRLNRGGSPEGFDYEAIRGDFEVNAIGPLRVVEAALGALRRGEGKKIVNLTSKMGSIAENSSGGSYAYRMSKAALNIATRSLALDLKPEGFVAFVIHPGWVQTRMGGENALITPETSVSNILARIDEAGADDSGQFLEWNGGRIPW